MKKLIISSLLLSGIGCAGHSHSSTAALQQGAPYSLTQTLPIAGDGRWDYLTFDAEAKQLYIPRQTHVQILDVTSQQIVADIPNTAGVHGVALAPDAGRAFASDGKAASVTIIDLHTHQVLGATPVSEGPDAIIYDPFSKAVFCFNGESANATVIDSAAAPGAPARATIPLGGSPEFAASDGKGHLYVNLEDKSEIVQIDTSTMQTTARWKIEGGEEPSGMAIDTVHHRLFSGCRNQVMAIVDYTTGKTLAVVPIGSGVDACAFDPKTNEAFASCGDGTVTVIKETSPGTFSIVQTIQTRTGARTMTLDPTTHTLYLPTAEFEAKLPGERRPKMKDGTFMMLIVKRSTP